MVGFNRLDGKDLRTAQRHKTIFAGFHGPLRLQVEFQMHAAAGGRNHAATARPVHDPADRGCDAAPCGTQSRSPGRA